MKMWLTHAHYASHLFKDLIYLIYNEKEFHQTTKNFLPNHSMTHIDAHVSWNPQLADFKPPSSQSPVEYKYLLAICLSQIAE